MLTIIKVYKTKWVKNAEYGLNAGHGARYWAYKNKWVLITAPSRISF